MNTKQTPERPRMTLQSALLTLCDVHTRDDEQIGFVIMAGATPPPYLREGQYVEAWEVIREAALRPVEASPLPGDDEVAREIATLVAQNPLANHFTYTSDIPGKVSAILARHREQATAPLREALETVYGELAEGNGISGETIRQISDAINAHPTKAESQEVESEPVCHEDDGCPCELAVLQRFWREHNQQTLPTPSFQDKTQINKRVQARYDFLMERHQHGHYESMLKCVHEELALHRDTANAQIAALQETVRAYEEALAGLWNECMANCQEAGRLYIGGEVQDKVRPLLAAHRAKGQQLGEGE